MKLWPSLRFCSIRSRLIAAVVAVHALLMAVFVADLVRRQADLLLQHQAERSTDLAGTLARAAGPGLASRNSAALQELVDGQRGEIDLLYAMILDDHGQVVAHTGQANSGPAVSDVSHLLAPQLLQLSVAVADCAAPVRGDGRILGAVRVGLGQQANRQRWQALIWSGVAFALLTIASGVLLAWLMAKRLEQRLRALQDVADDVRAGATDRRAELGGHDEIARLALDFNAMLDRLDEQRQALDLHAETLEQRVDERTEELQRAKELAESAAHAKTAFLANMSHEIRTPLNAVLGLVHLVKDEGVSPKQAERLGKIEHAGRHLLSVINDILDLSKIDADKLTLEHRAFAVADVLQTCLAATCDQAEAKGLRLTIDATGLPAQLCGDPARLAQILINFVANAIKFTERGSVTLAGRVVDERPAAWQLRFEVVDTGIGMEPDVIKRIFEPFVQGDSSRTRRFGGNGLGLAISRKLATRMDGRVGVVSELGRGSTFWAEVWLDKDSAALVAPVPQSSSAGALAQFERQHAGRSVLLAEDEELSCLVATLMLQAGGLEVVTAKDGLAAVDLVGRQNFAAILMDMQMPLLDGVEATQRIRALPQGRTVPIIGLSANALTEDRMRALAAGMDEYLTKPVEPALLYQTLDRLILAQRVPHGAPNSAAPQAHQGA